MSANDTHVFVARYFKPSGKYYTEGEFTIPTPHLWKAAEEFRRLYAVKQLPGLASGTWEGHVLLQLKDQESEHCYPCLIPNLTLA